MRKWDKNILVAGGNQRKPNKNRFSPKWEKSEKESEKVRKTKTKFDTPEQELEIIKVVVSKNHCSRHHFFITATSNHAF